MLFFPFLVFLDFFPFLVFISFFLLSLFILTFLVSYFPLLVVDLSSSSEEVFNHIYHTIGDNSDSPLTGDQGIDPVSVDTDPIISSDSLEGEERSPYIGSDEFNKIITDSDLKDDAPCRVDDSHKEHDPEQFLADKSKISFRNLFATDGV